MRSPKVWLACCLLFCVYCLSLLIEESHRVTYWAEDGAKFTELHFLGCVSLKDFRLKNRTVNLQELRVAFYRNLQDHFQASLRRSVSNQDKKHRVAKTILNRTQSADQVLVMRHNVCVILRTRLELQTFYSWLTSRAVSYAIKKDTFEWIKMGGSAENYDQLIVLKKGWPHSNCAKDFSAFHCLNSCFKKRFRLSEYFYWANETEPIRLKRKNQTIRDYEDACFTECGKESCQLVYLKPAKLNSENEKSRIFQFKAKPIIDELDFGVQLAGLICLILNVSINPLLSTAIRLASSKLKMERTKGCLLSWRLLLIFIGLLGCTCLLVCVILDYRDKIISPTRKETTRNLMHPETMHLVVCVQSTYPNPVDNDQSNLSMSQIEKITDGLLNKTIDRITLDFLDHSVEIEWEITAKVLFRTIRSNYLQRCFQLAIRPDEPHYEILLSISKLRLEFKHRMVYFLYLLAESENLNAKSYWYTGTNEFLKRTAKRSRLNGNCIDYAIYSHLQCSNRQDCLERCMIRHYFSVHRKMPKNLGENRPILVVDKDLFNQSEV